MMFRSLKKYTKFRFKKILKYRSVIYLAAIVVKNIQSNPQRCGTSISLFEIDPNCRQR